MVKSEVQNLDLECSIRNSAKSRIFKSRDAIILTGLLIVSYKHSHL